MPDEASLQVQMLNERREIDAANAKRDERMSVLEARFESLKGSYRLILGAFVTLSITVVGGCAAIILSSAGGQ